MKVSVWNTQGQIIEYFDDDICHVTEWEPWSACSVLCDGDGIQTRFRHITKDGDSCPDLEETRPCNNGLCSAIPWFNKEYVGIQLIPSESTDNISYLLALDQGLTFGDSTQIKDVVVYSHIPDVSKMMLNFYWKVTKYEHDAYGMVYTFSANFDKRYMLGCIENTTNPLKIVAPSSPLIKRVQGLQLSLDGDVDMDYFIWIVTPFYEGYYIQNLGLLKNDKPSILQVDPSNGTFLFVNEASELSMWDFSA